MKVIEFGHAYRVTDFDGGSSQRLKFMKRIGQGYPGNTGEPYPGTNCQELLRVLIDRVNYLDDQIACEENELILGHLRAALLEFEIRAARRHQRELNLSVMEPLIEDEPFCLTCGHIQCGGHQ